MRNPLRRRKTPLTASEMNQQALKRIDKSRFTIIPPEGVPLSFMRASLGARFGAQLLDLLITYGSLFAIILLVAYSGLLDWTSAMALFALLSFLTRIPYYIITELIWNGRTLGKKILSLRVISLNGRRLEPHQVVVRNLMKEAEVFIPISLLFSVVYGDGWTRTIAFFWLCIVFIVPIFSRYNQRFGDMIAGTCVVDQPKVASTLELAKSSSADSDRYVFLPMHLEHYGKFELQSLEQILREVTASQASYKRDTEVSTTIRRKIGFTDKVSEGEARQFLKAFYAAQRAHLESRQILGDRREDKHHKDDKTPV